MSGRITDHQYRPDRQGQWHTDRCDLCGEPRSEHDEWGAGWVQGYKQGRDDEAAGLPIAPRAAQGDLATDHRPDAATSTCREDGSPWPCEVERRARRTLAEVQAERTRDATKPYPVEVAEQSVDLTPGVVWTDAQLAVPQLVAALRAAVEALAGQLDAEAFGDGRGTIDAAPALLADRLRALLADVDGGQR